MCNLYLWIYQSMPLHPFSLPPLPTRSLLLYLSFYLNIIHCLNLGTSLTNLTWLALSLSPHQTRLPRCHLTIRTTGPWSRTKLFLHQLQRSQERQESQGRIHICKVDTWTKFRLTISPCGVTFASSRLHAYCTLTPTPWARSDLVGHCVQA
jgi:hypothetical protein